MGYMPPCSVQKCVEMDDDDVHHCLVATLPTAMWHHVVLAREGDGGVQGVVMGG